MLEVVSVRKDSRGHPCKAAARIAVLAEGRPIYAPCERDRMFPCSVPLPEAYLALALDVAVSVISVRMEQLLAVAGPLDLAHQVAGLDSDVRRGK